MLVALGIALVIVVLVGYFSRRIVIGLLGGAFIAAGIIFAMIRSGQGDMVALLLMFFVPIAAAGGALVGGIAGYAGKRVAASREPGTQEE